MYFCIYMMLILCIPELKEVKGHSYVDEPTLLQNKQLLTSSVLSLKPDYKSISLYRQLRIYHSRKSGGTPTTSESDAVNVKD